MSNYYNYYTRDIKDGNGKDLRVVLAYNPLFNIKLPNPERVLNEIIVPELEKKTTWYFGEKVIDVFYPLLFTYNFKHICWLSLTDPLACGGGYSTSFPEFVKHDLSEWAGKQIKVIRGYPPRNPWRFYCYGYCSGNNDYYFEADAEAALTRDFNEFPPNKDELAVWRALRRTKSPARASLQSKTLFLIEYGRKINTKSRIQVDEFTRLYL